MGSTEKKKALNDLAEMVKAGCGLDYNKQFDFEWEYANALFPEDKFKVIKKYLR